MSKARAPQTALHVLILYLFKTYSVENNCIFLTVIALIFFFPVFNFFCFFCCSLCIHSAIFKCRHSKLSLFIFTLLILYRPSVSSCDLLLLSHADRQRPSARDSRADLRYVTVHSCKPTLLQWQWERHVFLLGVQRHERSAFTTQITHSFNYQSDAIHVWCKMLLSCDFIISMKEWRPVI